MPNEAQYPIRAVSKLTGLPIDTLRAWERRYSVVAPTRDDRGRLYTANDISRLRLIGHLVSAGHRIGRIAKLTESELTRLTDQPKTPGSPSPAVPSALDQALFTAALDAFDGATIDQEFSRLATVLPPLELLKAVLFPAMRDIGDAWHSRRGGIAQEHLMSATLRHMLGSFVRLYSRRNSPVQLVFATPSGDRHEIGVLGAAMLAASLGLGVLYLGPDLPSTHMLAAVETVNARVLVVGLTLTDRDAAREAELQAIAGGVPAGVELWAGGAGVRSYENALTPRAITFDDFDTYMDRLAGFGKG